MKRQENGRSEVDSQVPRSWISPRERRKREQIGLSPSTCLESGGKHKQLKVNRWNQKRMEVWQVPRLNFRAPHLSGAGISSRRQVQLAVGVFYP